MNKTVLSVAASLALILGGGAAGAQTVDMSKFTCQELTSGPLQDSVTTTVWLSGYYNGKRNNTKVDAKKFDENAKAVVAYCQSNPKLTVMQAVNKLMPTLKR